MRKTAVLGVIALGVIAVGTTLLGACGGDEQVPSDGSTTDTTKPLNDVTQPPPDNFVDDQSAPTDSGTDTGVDAGPLCTVTPCIVQVTTGGRHACGLVNDGTIRCWGFNNAGQLGNGVDGGGFDASSHITPIQVGGINTATQISASTYSINYNSTCARLASGTVLCWGSNESAQQGLSAEAGIVDGVPHPFPNAPQGLGSMTQVRAMVFHMCAVNAANEMYCWGDNNGQILGRGPNPPGFAPVGMCGVDGGPVSATEPGPGWDYTLALTPSGTVLSWGANGSNQLGRAGGASGIPTAITGLSGVKQISAGMNFACVVTTAGGVMCWGGNGSGQLGRGLTGGQSQTPSAPSLPSTKQARQVAAGNASACAAMTDGTVYCWGNNTSGECGQSTGNTINTPAEVTGLSGKALQVSVGTAYACAVIEGGAVQCWGSNAAGQLGRGPDGGAIDAVPHPTPGTVIFN